MFFGSRLNRLATSIRRGISKYSVGSDNPGLVFDFIDNFYQKDKNQTVNFDGAITHARSGNAVMTDGYGPELVVNGGFTSDSDWTKGTGWSIANGYAHHASGANSNITQSIAVEADKAYIIEFNILEGSADFLWFAVAGVFTAVESPQVRGKRSFVFTHDTTESIAVGIRAGSSNVATIDSVSVREMPVLKWAPHNELTYSEDLTNGWGVQNGSIGSTGTADPNGVTTNTTLFIPSATSSNQHRVIGNNTSIFISSYRLSFWLKPSGYTKVGFRNGVTGEYAAFSLVGAGTVINESNCTATIVQDGDWYFCSVERDNVSGIRADIYTFDNGYTSGNPNGYTYTGDGTSGVYIWGAHVYRSDLGGMVDNPDRGDSYVPTTSSAVYLPRVGHHVYNGSAWVNEGLLAESESRTNKEKYSDFASSIIANNLTVSTDQAVSPDGTENATELTETGANDYHRVYQGANKTGTANSDHTFSAYVKRGSGTRDIQLRGFYLGTGAPYVNFDLGDGTVGSSSGASGTSVSGHTWTLSNTNIQDVGNGWYRVSATVNASSDFTVGFVLIDDASTAIELEVYQGDNTSSVLIYGAQFEAASTPSSLIPTSGSTVTRAAETFTIPSANLPWPEPNYIGSELVTNGTFDTDSDWIKGTGWTISGGTASSDGTQTGNSLLSQSSIIQSGKLYSLSIDVTRTAGAVWVSFTGNSNVTGFINTTKTVDVVFVASENSGINVTCNSGFIGSVDNISVREINPLSVSIAMEGRVTYANTWTSGTKQAFRFFSWRIDNDNKLLLKADSTDASGERLTATHEVNNVADFATFNDFVYEGVLQSVNVALRVGSTFFQVAANGQTGAENATLTSLVDLSATDLDLVDDDYMGTIGTFRVWDKDLGDDGLVEATNPSLEPSLSLTFEGTGTNSFVVNNWSE